jgi:hypothetical protein
LKRRGNADYLARLQERKAMAGQLSDAMGMPINNRPEAATAVMSNVAGFFLNTAGMLIGKGTPEDAPAAVDHAWEATKRAFSHLGLEIEPRQAADTKGA